MNMIVQMLQVLVEIVEKFDEEILDINTITPKIKCNTVKFLKISEKIFINKFQKKDAIELLKINHRNIEKFEYVEANGFI